MSTSSETANTTENTNNSLVEDETLLRFQPLLSCLDPNFWFKVCQLKLDVDKLDEVQRSLIGYYDSKSSPYISLDCSSFNQEINYETSSKYIAHGHCLNKNTIDSFKNCDKNELLKEFGDRMLDDFRSGRAVDNPSLIPVFHILMFSDLKKFIFYFWFAFPSFANPKYHLLEKPSILKNTFSAAQFDLLVSGFQNLNINQRGFFGVVSTDDGTLKIKTLKQFIDVLQSNVENGFTNYLVFADPSDLLNNPGWPLRNLLYLILLHCPSIRNSALRVIALRGSPASNFSASMLFNIKVSTNDETVFQPDDIKFVGWEKNSKGIFCPKYVDLSKTMDSKKQARESVDLNLKLMKWRIAPDLNLDIIAQSKCLIIGAGTLGCCIARNLMSWGVRNITFIDSGKVSYSNPVRQSLYKHAHCVNSNTYKATAAADVLREIHPEINSTGVVMSIPMPGHAASIDDHENVDLLSKLIKDHDVIFLVTDSRESRWLPTMLSTLHNKLAITAALGFDSYLVLRQGVEIQDAAEKKLGCYFCNDVTAPGNSLVDRTLDQQCTVTRPGVSSIAGALAVELFVSCVQLKYDVPANATSCLGVVPHSIRGFLCDFQQIMPFTPSFFQCIACSSIVVNDFLNNREEFLTNVFRNPNYLEDLTGLTDLKNEFENIQILELNDSDVEDSGTYNDLTVTASN